MCLAIPARIVEINDVIAVCRVGDSAVYINVSLMLLECQCHIGEYLIVHAGFALRKLDEIDAQETLRLLRQVAEAAGEAANF
ncbi:Hydrogenase maturation factor HypC [Desulfovibrionales bacterium]